MLELKQTLRLSPVLTQQLQQAIKLLQLSRLELIEAIELEVQENPILDLEEKEPKEDQPVEHAGQGSFHLYDGAHPGSDVLLV